MKITIIKPKTGITMKPNNFTFQIPLLANRYPLTANSCPLSITSASGEPGNPPKCGQNPFTPNKPNFKLSRMSVTHDMIRTYNANQPKKRKKNKPKTSKK